MKNLFEYCISAVFAILLLVMTYQYYGATLAEMVSTSFDQVTVAKKRTR